MWHKTKGKQSKASYNSCKSIIGIYKAFRLDMVEGRMKKGS